MLSRTVPLALAVALLLAAHPGAAQGTAPPQYLERAFAGEPQLTQEQAESIAGVWDMVSDSRIDGHLYDQALLAVAAALAEGNDTVDPVAVAREALSSLQKVDVELRVWMPYVNATDGFFYGYLLVSKGGNLTSIQRRGGVATAGDDGTIRLSWNMNEDTGAVSAIADGDKMVSLLMEGLEELDFDNKGLETDAGLFSNTPTVIDNQAIALFHWEKQPASEVKGTAAQVVEFLKSWYGAA